MGRPKRGAAAAAEKAIKGDDAASADANKKSKSGLTVGDALPSFQLETDTETTVSSADLVKDNGIVLFCYPKANTAGCTTQAVGLSEKASELAEAGFKVYGISADKPKSQANWKKKANITCTLLCDPSHDVLPELGFIKGGKINRSHIVVAKGGKVLDVQYGVKPKDSIKQAVEFCMANKAEPLAAEDAEAEGEEAAAAAPEEPSKEELKQEEEEAPAPADKAGDDKAEEQTADKADNKEGDGEGAAAMDVDEAAAAADAEQPEQQQEQEEKAEETTDKATADAAAGGAAEQPAEDQAGDVQAEPDTEEQKAAEDDKPAEDAAAGGAEAAGADDEPAGADKEAAAAAADDGDDKEPAADTAGKEELAESDTKEEAADKKEEAKDASTEAPAAAEAYAA